MEIVDLALPQDCRAEARTKKNNLLVFFTDTDTAMPVAGETRDARIHERMGNEHVFVPDSGAHKTSVAVAASGAGAGAGARAPSRLITVVAVVVGCGCSWLRFVAVLAVAVVVAALGRGPDQRQSNSGK